MTYKNLISFFLFFNLLLSFSAGANECMQVLANDYSQDSRSFKIYDHELRSDYDVSPEIYSAEAIELLFDKIGCNEGPSKKSLDSVSCHEIVPRDSYSNVCYVESEYGYFFISKDMLDSVNIIFNRWD